MTFRGIARFKDGTKLKYNVNNVDTYQEALRELRGLPGIQTALVLLNPLSEVEPVEIEIFEPQTA